MFQHRFGLDQITLGGCLLVVCALSPQVVAQKGGKGGGGGKPGDGDTFVGDLVMIADGKMFVTDILDQNRQPLAASGGHFFEAPTHTPNGTIVYLREKRNAEPELWEVNVDGSGERLVVAFNLNEFPPEPRDFTNGGINLATTASEVVYTRSDWLLAVELATGNVRVIYVDVYGGCMMSDPTLSLARRQIAVSTNCGEILLLDFTLDDAGLIQVVSTRDTVTRLFGDGKFRYHSEFSPTGNKIAFTEFEDGIFSNRRVGIHDFVTNTTTYTLEGELTETSWSSDGQFLIYEVDGDISMLDANNPANQVKITQTPDVGEYDGDFNPTWSLWPPVE